MREDPAATNRGDALISGWIDFDRLEPPPDQSGRRSPPAEIAGAGLSLRFGPKTSACTVGHHIVLSIGAPRFSTMALSRRSSSNGNAAAWAEHYAESGIAGFASVRGTYAVVIVDMSRRQVVMAVDRFAIHNLYYAQDARRLAFGSRADAVPRTKPSEIDPQAVFDYLYFHVIPAPRTVFRSVWRVPAAHVAVIGVDNTVVSPHWRPTFDENPRVPIDTLKGEFRELLRDAVCREAGSSAVGAFLSGGTDSSTVAGYLGRISGHPAKTYSIGFDAQGYDEMSYARIAARHFGTEHHEYYVTPDDLVRSIPEVAAQFDQPFGNSSVLPAFCCASMARADGVDKLLAGDGGDELFGGNTRYAKQRVFAMYDHIPQLLRRVVIEPVLLGVPGVGRIPGVSKGASYVRQARVPMPARMNTYNLLMRLGVDTVLTRDFLDRVDIGEPEAHQCATWSACNTDSLVNRMLAYDWVYTLADNDLPKVCGATALAGVEVGFPLLADELVDFSLRLPSALKLRGLKLRWFFKEALRDFLPPEIITKTKHGFGLPFGVWATQHKPLRDLAKAALANVAARGVVRSEFVDALVDERLPEHPGYYGEMVWILMMLGQWLSARESVSAR